MNMVYKIIYEFSENLTFLDMCRIVTDNDEFEVIYFSMHSMAEDKERYKNNFDVVLRNADKQIRIGQNTVSFCNMTSDEAMSKYKRIVNLIHSKDTKKEDTI